MDPLTPVLGQLSVRGTVFSRARLEAPWGVHTAAVPRAIFHVVVRGAGWARTLDAAGRPTGEALPWRAGDLVLFPRGTAHAMTHSPGAPTRSIRALSVPPGDDGLPCIRVAGGGPETSLLCGTLRFDAQAADMILPHLPELLHVPADDAHTAAWMDATLRMLGAEVGSHQPGAEAVVARLAEILFVQAVRAWAGRGGLGSSWLAALGDPGLAAALAAMHGEPARSWTVGELARVAAMSRSAFAARFAEATGSTPAAHLTRWRLLLARRALAQSDAGLTEIAEQVGYGSQASFIRAFTREHGLSPTRWRRAQAA